MASVQVVSAAGTTTGPIRISSIIWSAATTAGDTCIVKYIGGEDIWEGRASGAQTYQGVVYPDHDPVAAPGGIEVSTLAAGRLFIYKED